MCRVGDFYNFVWDIFRRKAAGIVSVYIIGSAI